MELRDLDLKSIQEARLLIEGAVKAQSILKTMDQATIDRIVKAMATAAAAKAVELAKMAHEETGFGIWQDKVIKNEFAALKVYEYVKDLKTVGLIREDREKKFFEVGVPMGVITALIPSTNPTSTTIFKAIIAVKAGNAIIFSPHPSARKCILETAGLVSEAAVAAGAPEGLITCMTIPTKEGTHALMTDERMALILATGGSAMVHAAYSSGTPAIGVGPGNGPAFIERTADIPLAVKRIISSKTFDNSTICASEQSIVTERCIKNQVMEELQRQGGYFLPPGDAERVEKVIYIGGAMNAKLVGRSPQEIARAARITIPDNTRVLIAEECRVGHNVPFSREKLMPVLAFYVEEDWERACDRCIEILTLEGAGHNLSIHSRDENVIRAFGLKKPVSRLLVNTSSSVGAIGGTTNLVPSLTLGCGAVGHNASSDNIGPLNLINIRRVAYGVTELDDLRAASAGLKAASGGGAACAAGGPQLEDASLDLLVKKIVDRLRAAL